MRWLLETKYFCFETFNFYNYINFFLVEKIQSLLFSFVCFPIPFKFISYWITLTLGTSLHLTGFFDFGFINGLVVNISSNQLLQLKFSGINLLLLMV